MALKLCRTSIEVLLNYPSLKNGSKAVNFVYSTPQRSFSHFNKNNIRETWKKYSNVRKFLGTCGVTGTALYLSFQDAVEIGKYMELPDIFRVTPDKSIADNIIGKYVHLSNLFRVKAAKPVLTDADEPQNVQPLEPSRSQKFNFIADVVEKTAPAVVYLEIFGRHPLYGHTIPISNGSGFIIQEDGLIITNAHVVANRSSVVVKLYDGRIFNGQVEDIDSVSDLATVRIPCRNLPILRLGSSAKLRPGEWVVAMGSPLSLSNTITSGIISTVNRGSKELGIRHKNLEYIQTDASINVGNSGGPLINLDGEAIGINTMKVTAGISFAIPADYAKDFLKRVEEKKKASWGGWFGKSKETSTHRRPYMGITMLALNPTLILELQQRQSDFPADVNHGVLIWKIVIGSPAYKGGLQPGDIITHINGREIVTTEDVNTALDSNRDLNMNVIRKHQRLTLTVVPENGN